MNSYTKFHFAITKDGYEERPETALSQNVTAAEQVHFSITAIPPRYGSFRLLFEQVGKQWRWTSRPKYCLCETALKERLQAPVTKLYLLQHRNVTVGYCLAAPTTEDLDRLPGLTAAQNPIEIENFGLFPEHTGRQYGRIFLSMIFKALFAEHDTIYLSTRSTNHKGVVPFYKKMGMTLLHQETLPNDLLPETGDAQRKAA